MFVISISSFCSPFGSSVEEDDDEDAVFDYNGMSIAHFPFHSPFHRKEYVFFYLLLCAFLSESYGCPKRT